VAGDEEISLLAIGTILLRRRWAIARWMFIGGVIAALSVIRKPPLYMATASFIPQGNEANRASGLANIAGQFGVSLPTANASQSPEFYARLLRSRVILQSIVRDTFIVAERGGGRMTFYELFEINDGSTREREEKAVAALRQAVNPSIAKTTGGVDVGVTTRWPSVSLAIVEALVAGVNDFNQRTRQTQAAGERSFAYGQMVLANDSLRAAEERLERFQVSNRGEYQGSPQLQSQHDRLQRDVMMKQQLYTSLAQSYEDAKIREVRDTPVITVLEPPYVPTFPEPRGRVTSTVSGIVLGGLFGMLFSFGQAMLQRRRQAGHPEANEFVSTIEEIRSNTIGRVWRQRGRKSP
jgi:uncharacterized protein involved in exopolysaccharide biosynthesis